MVGVAKRTSACRMQVDRLCASETSVMTTNCSPVRAAAADPTIR
jgi:hypothetical protein